MSHYSDLRDAADAKMRAEPQSGNCHRCGSDIHTTGEFIDHMDLETCVTTLSHRTARLESLIGSLVGS
jgi:hypothetical protein